MKTIPILFSALAVLLFASCGNDNKTNKETPIALKSFTNTAPNTEAKSFFLGIVSESTTDSTHIYITESLYGQDTVGLRFEVNNDIPAGIFADGSPNEDQGFTVGTVKITSLGEKSDNFVKALAEIFDEKTNAGMTNNVIEPNVFSSNQKVITLDQTGTYSFKLFLDNAVADPAEIFFNIDTYKKAIEFTEKDTHYRSGLISALIGQ